MDSESPNTDGAAEFGCRWFGQDAADTAATPESLLRSAVAIDDEVAVSELLAAGDDPNAVTDSGSMLSEAAWRGHVGVLKLLLAAGAHPDIRGPRAMTPLMQATDHFEVVAALLDAGADLNAVDDDGWCPLAYAAHSVAEAPEYWECPDHGLRSLDLLLQRGADPNIGNAAGCPPLGILLGRDSRTGEVEAAALALLRHGADPDSRYLDFFSEFNRNWSSLSLAAHHGSVSTVKALLERGADSNLSYDVGLAPLNLALERGDDEIVTMLEAAGAAVPEEADTDLETAIAWGHTADALRLLPLASLDSALTTGLLLLAIERWGRPEIVRALIDGGADPNALGGDPEQPFSALSLAVSARRPHAVRVLLEMGADPEKQAESSALMKVAAEHGDIGILEEFLDHGVPVDVPDHEAWTPLMAACHCSQLEAVRFLIRRGANVNAATLNNQPDYLGGATPLMTAAKIEDGDPAILVALLEAGADLEVADCGGNTALFWAARCGSMTALRLLLERGADIASTTASGFKVLDFAMSNGHEEAAELLQAAGAEKGTGRWGSYTILMRSAVEEGEQGYGTSEAT